MQGGLHVRNYVIFAMSVSLLAVAVQAANEAILIFGGDEHDVFLGCLNCAETDPNSVWNESSKFGWVNNYGVWNEYGQYGGKYGSHSACNEYTSNPPILVDREGNSYGYLGINPYKAGSVCSSSGVEQVCRALRVMCAHAG